MRKLSILLAVALLAGCSLPWNEVDNDREVNLALTVENNQLSISSATLDGVDGTFVLATAYPRTVVSPGFVKRHALGEHAVLRLGVRSRIELHPAVLEIGPNADGYVGADAWGNNAIAIDYQKGLVSVTRTGHLHSDGMVTYRFVTEPRIPVVINGTEQSAIVDTLVPDTLIVPRALTGSAGKRAKVRLAVAGRDLGSVDVRVSDESQEVRVGNRVLANFLVSIDYGKKVVALWPDVRVR